MSNTKSSVTGSTYRQIYEGEHLSEISFPLGGIGTGCIGLGGRGDLREWEIFNRPSKWSFLPYSFFALWSKQEGKSSDTRILERRLTPPFRSQNGVGLPSAMLAGMPRFEHATFRGEFPFAWIALSDKRVPLEIELEAFNPLIPLNSDDSQVPGAIFSWKLRNAASVPVKASVCASLMNAVGYEPSRFENRSYRGAGFGTNRNVPSFGAGWLGLWMTSDRFTTDDLSFGSMALLAKGDNGSILPHWPRERWWHPTRLFWDSFSSDGRLHSEPVSDEDSSPEGRTDVGSVAISVQLAPGAQAEIPFVIAWHFPNRDNYFDRTGYRRTNPESEPAHLHNYYARRFGDALETATYTLEHLERLRSETLRYHEALYSSTLPPEVLEAVGSTVSVLKSPTLLRVDDGALHGFEGIHDDIGSCPMDCTHVWNYDQTLPHLFPDLARSMRATEFERMLFSSGEMAFRSRLPLSLPLYEYKPAADGQLGSILKLYREWLLSGDRIFLERVWPNARRALEWVWQGGAWDIDGDGVIEGEQHNTLDIEFFGPNPMIGTYYLAALRSGAILAGEVGEDEFTRRCQALFDRGSPRMDAELWNGDYYVQRIDLQAPPESQFGNGCLTDQLIGQWWAHLLGLGYLLPEERVRSAMRSVFLHNFHSDLSEHQCHERTYALNDEAGMVICSWPSGDRPRIPHPYASECWSGVEYAAASLLMMEGCIEGGLAVVRAVRNRYDGRKRNPWNEEECGHNYVRPLAAYSLLLALSGFRCDVARGVMQFSPVWSPQRFRTFWSAGTGWGVFAQELQNGKLSIQLDVHGGSICLKRLDLTWPDVTPPASVRIEASTTESCSASIAGRSLSVNWADGTRLNAGLSLSLAFASTAP